MKKIDPENLIPMDFFVNNENFALEIDLVYGNSDNILFRETIYHPEARLWLHEDLAKIVLLASLFLKQQGLILVLHDGLRTVEAQEKMAETQRARTNPSWTQGQERLLSPPGAGAHPRAMAIDVSIKMTSGDFLDMGTPFDELAEDSSPAKNPAHRDYSDHTPKVMKNRQVLEFAMTSAADMLHTPLLGLPAEWWDFRQPKSIYETFEPLSEADLPPQMRMTDIAVQNNIPNFSDEYFEDLKIGITEEVLATFRLRPNKPKLQAVSKRA